ncbi:MAG: hypothetical protein NT126_03280 [Bacteroidetes bacterium]|nr:hypothetical protein [Bacteroidota bacterium]
MLANILKSKKARQTSISIVRAFIALKEFALNHSALSEKIKKFKKKYNKQFKDVYEAIHYTIYNTQDKIIQSALAEVLSR